MYLKIENISKIFEKERGVKNISFQLEKGELVSFLGPSGCGKTTCRCSPAWTNGKHSRCAACAWRSGRCTYIHVRLS